MSELPYPRLLVQFTLGDAIMKVEETVESYLILAQLTLLMIIIKRKLLIFLSVKPPKSTQGYVLARLHQEMASWLD